MNILLGVHQFFPQHYSGTERYVLNLARQLCSMGHRVRVLTYDFHREATEPVLDGRLLVREYAYQGIPVTAFSHAVFPDFTYDLLNEDFARATGELLRREPFDVYHCAHPMRIGGSLLAAKDAGIPTVLMLTDYWLICPMGILLRWSNMLCGGPNGGDNCRRYCFTRNLPEEFSRRALQAAKLARCADRILSPSRFLIGMMHHNRFMVNRIALSRHGFDYALISGQGQPMRDADQIITVGYIGTVQYHKGVHVLVKAFRKVSSPRLRLRIWGGCFHETAYASRVRRLAKGDERIQFLGAYNYEDLEQIMEGIDLVVVPSIWYENAPLTITSSHALGIPVIASDIGGMAEVIADGENGFTFRAGDAGSLAERLAAIANSPELLARFRDAIVPPPGLEEEAFRMERLYRSLAAAEPPAAAQ
jgi:glycosyltransferase involved in cell wall biosynthesis